jgi:hypothetical protein
MRQPRRRLPPRRPSTGGYHEATSFRVNPELREDVERLRRHFKCATAGELFRSLIRIHIDQLDRAPA